MHKRHKWTINRAIQIGGTALMFILPVRGLAQEPPDSTTASQPVGFSPDISSER